MKAKLISALAICACAVTSVWATPALWHRSTPNSTASATPAKITGDYVEARTASVMAGPCHYNGELVTTGQDALLAWNFSGGSFGGVDLSGVRAMASVTADDNLGLSDASRKSELTVDTSASEAQVSALVALLRSKCGDELGRIAEIHRAPVNFVHGDKGYSVESAGFGSLTVSYRTDDTCCTQPGLVWYSPMMALDHRKVGFTELATYSGDVGYHWQRSGEDSAFYGSFTF